MVNNKKEFVLNEESTQHFMTTLDLLKHDKEYYKESKRKRDFIIAEYEKMKEDK